MDPAAVSQLVLPSPNAEGALQLLLFQLLKLVLQQPCDNAAVSSQLEYLEAIERWHVDLENKTSLVSADMDNYRTRNDKLAQTLAETEVRLKQALDDVEALKRDKSTLEKQLKEATEDKKECCKKYEAESLANERLRDERDHLQQDLIAERGALEEMRNISDKLDHLMERFSEPRTKTEEYVVPISNQVPAGLEAAKRGDVDALQLLLKRGLDVNAVDEVGASMVFYAAREGHTEVVRLLLQKGANPNLRTFLSKDSPLHEAAYYCKLDTLQELLQHGADINAQDKGNSTPLHEAVYMNCVPCVRELLNKGADRSLTNYDRHTALTEATNRNYKDIQNLLQQNSTL